MAASGNFDYDRLLSLDQAKLVGRSRLNSLGSYELTLNYNKITSATKEDSLEWLEANRLTITDPTFSFKTYEGTWNCVSISYNEDRNIIQQIFKIDSSVGNLGEVTDPPSYDTQEGDVSRISAGMTIEKAYYWRVTSPTDVVLPTARAGEIWTKTANDNGDGTYDVTVAKEVANDLESTSSRNVFLYTESTVVNSNATSPASNPAHSVGTVVRVNNTKLENGKYRTEVTTRTAVMLRIPATEVADTGGVWTGISSLSWFNDWDVSQTAKMVTAYNRTYTQFLNDFTTAPNTAVVSPSVSVNEFGLYDYTIRAMT